MNRRDWYARVNAAWPAGPLPKLTGEEALKATRRLFRFCKLAKHRLALTSGRRHTWYRYGTFYVNPDKGWHNLVHNISHWVERCRTGDAHSKTHARLELRLVKQVVKRGWLEGKLRRQPKPTLVDAARAACDPMAQPTPLIRRATPDEEKLAHARRMMAKATTRAKRAQTILRKWARRVARLEKKAAPMAAAG